MAETDRSKTGGDDFAARFASMTQAERDALQARMIEDLANSRRTMADALAEIDDIFAELRTVFGIMSAENAAMRRFIAQYDVPPRIDQRARHSTPLPQGAVSNHTPRPAGESFVPSGGPLEPGVEF